VFPDDALTGELLPAGLLDPHLPPAFSPEEAKAFALSREQRRAIEMMLNGSTLGVAASAAGVTRMTLYRWLKHDANFQAAYNAWQQDALVAARTRLLALTDVAVTTVSHAAKHDARIALSLLKSLGALERPTPGSTDPTEVRQRIEIDRQKADAQLGEELLFASIGTSFSSLNKPIEHNNPGKRKLPSVKSLIKALEEDDEV
jgi:hypothetical protein